FTAAAFHSDWPSITQDPWGLVRLAIPVTVGSCGLLLRNAYADPIDRPPHASGVDVMVVFALAFLSQAILWLLKPELALPRWAPTQGGFVGFSLLAACRSLFPSGRTQAELSGPISPVELQWKLEELKRRAERSTRFYLVLSTLLIAL